MRNYQILDTVVAENNSLQFNNSEDNPEHPWLTMSREGRFLAFSASFGPIEIALRLRLENFQRRIDQLYAIPGLATTHQVGTANSYIAIGLTTDERLVLRPTVVTDASGHLTFNLVLTADVYNTLRSWLKD